MNSKFMLSKLNKSCLFFNRLIQTKTKIQLKSIQNYQSNNTKSIIYANKIDTNNNNNNNDKYYLHWYALAITGLTILFNDFNNKQKNVLLAKEVSNQDSNNSSSSSNSNNTSNSKDILESDNDEENEIEISKDKKLKFSFRDRKVFNKHEKKIS